MPSWWDRNAKWFALGWIMLATVFFYVSGLSNNGSVSRMDYWSLVPFQLMDLVDPEFPSRLPHGWAYMGERIWFTLLAGFVVAGSAGWGWLAMLVSTRFFTGSRSSSEEPPTTLEQVGTELFFAVSIGLAITSTETLLVGLAGGLSSTLVAAWLLPGCVLAFVGLKSGKWTLGRSLGQSIREAWESRNGWTLAAWAGVMLFLWTFWLGGLSPTTDFDVKEYHLGGPKEYFLTGRIEFLPHNVYTSFPFLTEMLSLAAMTLVGDWLTGSYVATATLSVFGPLTALGLWSLCQRWYPPAANWAALIWITVPWTYRLSTIAYVEEAFSCYLLAAFFAVLRAISYSPVSDPSRISQPITSRWSLPLDGTSGWWWLAGLSAGAAFGCKYPALLFVVAPIGLFSLSRVFKGSSGDAEPVPWMHRLVPPLVFSLGVLIFAGPWLAKNVWQTGNPVYPLLYSIFGGVDWNDQLNEKWRRGHSPPHYSPVAFFTDAFDILVRSDWQSGLILLGLPLAWLVPNQDEDADSWPEGVRNLLRMTLLYLSWFYVAWWLLTHRIDRFWAPMLPLLTILSSVGLARLFKDLGRFWRHGLLTIVTASVIFNFSINTGPVGNYNAWLIQLKAASDFTARTTCPEIAAINLAIDEGVLSKNIRVLMVGEAEIFDARFDVRYNTVFDLSLIEEWCTHPDGTWRDETEIRRKFADEGITHIFVNWREILRYRTSYGYTDFVNPGLFEKLRKMKLIGGPIPWPEGLGELKADNLSAADRKLIQSWGPELLQKFGQEKRLITAELFPVLPGK